MSSNNPRTSARFTLRQLFLAVALVGLEIVNLPSLLMIVSPYSVSNSTYIQLESAQLGIGLDRRLHNDETTIAPCTELDDV